MAIVPRSDGGHGVAPTANSHGAGRRWVGAREPPQDASRGKVEKHEARALGHPVCVFGPSLAPEL